MYLVLVRTNAQRVIPDWQDYSIRPGVRSTSTLLKPRDDYSDLLTPRRGVAADTVSEIPNLVPASYQ